MGTNPTEVVFIDPADDLAAIMGKVQAVDARTAQLLVPPGVGVLRDPQALATLHKAAAARNMRVMLVTDDEATLNAARGGPITVMGLANTQVQAPGAAQRKPQPPARRPAPASDADDAALRRLLGVAPAKTDDAALLAALDDLPTETPAPRYRPPPADYTDFEAELDALSRSPTAETRPQRTAPSRSGARPTGAGSQPTRTSTAARRAVEPTAPTPRAPTPRSIDPLPSHPVSERRSVQPAPALEPERRRGVGWPILALAGVLLGLLAVIGALLVFGNQATVAVTLPVPITEAEPFTSQVVPLVAPGAPESSSAVQAEPLRVSASFSATGSVTDEVLTPVAAAQGEIQILSVNTQPFEIPAGSEFIAVNEQGQEVRFTSDTAVVVPGATTARQGAQIITSLGQATIPVTARAPGSGGNVAGNTITQMVLPGQGPVSVRSGGALEVSHAPISGGREEPVRIVKDADVQRVLGEALVGLDNQARQELSTQASAAGLDLAAGTITPDTSQLSRGEGYEVVVDPPVGTQVDYNNPIFTVTVSSEFSALATLPGESLEDQLQSAVTEQLLLAGLMAPDNRTAPFITDWNWTGERLTVEGELRPTGRPEELSPRNRAAIVDAIRGKSRAEAAAALEGFVDQGIISDYTLPDQSSLPGQTFQIDLRILQAEPQPQE